MKSLFKIRIFQPIVPEYRVALFNGLGRHYRGRVEIWAAESIGGDLSCPLADMPFDYDHPFKRIGPFLWQRRLSLKGLSKGDVVVVCGDIHQLSSLWIAFLAKLKRIKIIWWGHHYSAHAKRSNVKARLWIAQKVSDVYLCYTRTGVDYLERHGFAHGRVFYTGNTIDQNPIKAAVAQYDGHDMFDGYPGILCCSVLREKVRLDLAIRALADDRLSEVRLAVIGDGEKRVYYQKVASDVGVANRIIWVGATRDQRVMAPWFLSAKCFVYPGSVGLSILHAMSYGLPVVVHDNPMNQMPEYEIMVDGETGLCFKEGDVDDLAAKIERLVYVDALRQKISKECRRLAFEKYSMEEMVANYAETIEAVSKI